MRGASRQSGSSVGAALGVQRKTNVSLAVCTARLDSKETTNPAALRSNTAPTPSINQLPADWSVLVLAGDALFPPAMTAQFLCFIC